MVQEPGGLGFLLETPQPVRVVGERGRQHFDRHLAREPRVLRAVDLSHPPAPIGRENLVRAQPAAGRYRHLNSPVLAPASSRLARILDRRFAKRNAAIESRSSEDGDGGVLSVAGHEELAAVGGPEALVVRGLSAG